MFKYNKSLTDMAIDFIINSVQMVHLYGRCQIFEMMVDKIL